MKSKIFKILIDLISKTWNINTNNIEVKDNSIIAFWHGKMLPVWFYFKFKNSVGVVSKSKDGQILSDLLEHWNYQLIRGSSSKGGKEVLDSIIDRLNNNTILITPDGPRGPKEEFKPGIFIASNRSGKAFYFVDVKIKNKYIFKKAWDKFEFPMPFTNIYLDIKGPYNVPTSLNKEELNKFIQEFEL